MNVSGFGHGPEPCLVGVLVDLAPMHRAPAAQLGEELVRRPVLPVLAVGDVDGAVAGEAEHLLERAVVAERAELPSGNGGWATSCEAVNTLISDLVQRGLIRRTRDRNDRRTYRLTLTPAGRQTKMRPRFYPSLVNGRTGSGKTTLGTQFALAGASAGEVTLYVALAETPGRFKVRLWGADAEPLPATIREIAAAAKARGLGVMGIRAVQAGALTDGVDRSLPPEHPTMADFRRAAPLRELARELGESPASLAHRYALSMPGVDTVVLGVKDRTELRECVTAASAGVLTSEIMAAEDRGIPRSILGTRMALFFRDLGHEPVGLEGAPAFARMAREHSGCEVWEQDFLALELPRARFDGIFANAALFHVPSQELPRVLGELRAALKPRVAHLRDHHVPAGTKHQGVQVPPPSALFLTLPRCSCRVCVCTPGLPFSLFSQQFTFFSAFLLFFGVKKKQIFLLFFRVKDSNFLSNFCLIFFIKSYSFFSYFF